LTASNFKITVFVLFYRWSKAINLNLRSFILVKDINKIIEVSAACGVQLGTLLILKISVTAARCSFKKLTKKARGRFGYGTRGRRVRPRASRAQRPSVIPWREVIVKVSPCKICKDLFSSKSRISAPFFASKTFSLCSYHNINANIVVFCWLTGLQWNNTRF
jgi:hypothetical protein